MGAPICSCLEHVSNQGLTTHMRLATTLGGGGRRVTLTSGRRCQKEVGLWDAPLVSRELDSCLMCGKHTHLAIEVRGAVEENKHSFP